MSETKFRILKDTNGRFYCEEYIRYYLRNSNGYEDRHFSWKEFGPTLAHCVTLSEAINAVQNFILNEKRITVAELDESGTVI